MTTSDVILETTLTCPICKGTSTQIMPTNACAWFFACPDCGEVLRPLPGDCCVFCSYATVPCPPIQEGRDCCS